LEPGRLWRESSAQAGSVLISLSNLTVDLPRIAARTTYRTATDVWDQNWVLLERDDSELAFLLTESGVRLTSAAGPWVTAIRET
jgi:hypothetical protein